MANSYFEGLRNADAANRELGVRRSNIRYDEVQPLGRIKPNAQQTIHCTMVSTQYPTLWPPST
jgi:hypothetical protein